MSSRKASGRISDVVAMLSRAAIPSVSAGREVPVEQEMFNTTPSTPVLNLGLHVIV